MYLKKMAILSMNYFDCTRDFNFHGLTINYKANFKNKAQFW